MLDYDLEAERYDATRGGAPRARAAADAVAALLPARRGRLLDLACGTGIVTEQLARQADVVGLYRSAGMLALAVRRLGQVVLRGDVCRLPVHDASFDAVTAIWLLHLLPDAAPAIAEAARVLRPGGVFVTTVDKNASTDDDITRVLRPEHAHPRCRGDDSAARDTVDVVTRLAQLNGLLPAGSGTFLGHGQGRSPRQVADDLRARRRPAADPAGAARRLMALPDPDRPRPDPRYRLLAFRREPPRSDRCSAGRGASAGGPWHGANADRILGCAPGPGIMDR